MTPMRGKDGTVFPYALGWFVQTIDGLRVAWHHGWWDATSTLVVKVPERELTIVIMADSDMLSRLDGHRLSGFKAGRASPPPVRAAYWLGPSHAAGR